MKIGDKIILEVHGAGVVSEEEGIIEDIDDISLTLEDDDKVFTKRRDGLYKYDDSFFGFRFIIKEKR